VKDEVPADRRVALHRLAVTVVAVGVTFVGGLVLIGRSPGEVQDSVDRFGSLAPVAFCVLTVGLTCAFFPFPVIAAAGGVLFGVAAGTALSVAGGTLGALAAFAIARRFGAAPVQALAGEALRRLIAAVGRRGFVAVLYLRIFPGVPRDLANYLCGLTTIGVLPYGAATLIGITPRAYAYTALGGSLGDLGSTQSVVAVVLLIGLGLLGLGLVARDRYAD
jgi:uncharacterized membrane protein YdjX (TVP38/TMEM64 family)